MSVPVDLRGTNPQVGSPQRLFETRFRLDNYRGYGIGHVYDVAPDGKRFLVNVLGAEPVTPSSVTVVTNWTSLLR